MRSTAFNFEIRRKIFHLYSLVFPTTYLLLPKSFIITILFLLSFLVLGIDIARHYDSRVKELTKRFFAKIMRKGEENGSFRLSGATFMFFGLFFTALFFSKGLAITAWLIQIISDCLAALVGAKIGTPTPSGKSMEGSVTFFVSALFISIICYFSIGYNTNFFIITASCLASTLVEFYSKRLNIDDNLSIPLAYGFCTNILVFIFKL